MQARPKQSTLRSICNTSATVLKTLALPALNGAVSFIAVEGMNEAEGDLDKEALQTDYSSILLVLGVFTIAYSAGECVTNLLKSGRPFSNTQRSVVALNVIVAIVCAAYFISFFSNESEGVEYDSILGNLCAAGSTLGFNCTNNVVSFFTNNNTEEGEEELTLVDESTALTVTRLRLGSTGDEQV